MIAVQQNVGSIIPSKNECPPEEIFSQLSQVLFEISKVKSIVVTKWHVLTEVNNCYLLSSSIAAISSFIDAHFIFKQIQE